MVAVWSFAAVLSLAVLGFHYRSIKEKAEQNKRIAAAT